MNPADLQKGDFVAPATPGEKYWEAEVVAVYGDLVRLSVATTSRIPIEWTVPIEKVFLVWRRH